MVSVRCTSVKVRCTSTSAFCASGVNCPIAATATLTCAKVPCTPRAMSSNGILLSFCTMSATCGCSSLSVPATVGKVMTPSLSVSATRGNLGMKSSATKSWPVSKLPVRSCARKPLSTRRCSKAPLVRVSGALLSAAAVRTAPRRSG